MSIEHFPDYIKEDMWHGPDFQSTNVYSHHDSHFPHPPAFDNDFDVLCLLAQDKPQMFEQPIGNEWDQPLWGSSDWLCGGVADRPDSHWGTVETGFNPNPWGVIPTTNLDMCANTWSALSLYDGLSPNVPGESFPIRGLYPPALHHQLTEPSVNGPPLGNSKQGLHLETRMGEFPHYIDSPLLQATVSETSRTEISYTGATHGTSNWSIGPSLSDGQLSGERHLNQEIESRSSLSPPKSAAHYALTSSSKAKSSSAGSSSHRKRKASLVSTPSHPLKMPRVDSPNATLTSQYANGGYVLRNRTVPTSQSSLHEDATECETARHTPRSTSVNSPCTSEAAYSQKPSSEATNGPKRPICKQGSPPKSKALDSQALESLLIKWGFVRTQNTVRCTCGQIFKRRHDAKRHWECTFLHKAKRQKSGDSSVSKISPCKVCKEVLSREDSLGRHFLKCGLRRKRRYPYGWDPNGST